MNDDTELNKAVENIPEILQAEGLTAVWDSSTEAWNRLTTSLVRGRRKIVTATILLGAEHHATRKFSRHENDQTTPGQVGART